MGAFFKATIKYPPGVGPDIQGTLDIGDVVLTRGNSMMSKLIRFGQRYSLWGVDPVYAKWNHAGIITSPEGDMDEALLSGIVPTHISDYRSREYYIVHLNLSDLDKAQIEEFCSSARGVRTRYGVVTILSIIVTLLTGSKLVFSRAGTAICSGYVSEALCRAGFIFPKAPSHMMPGDLAQMFQVRE